MMRYADPSVCPDCRTQLPADPAACPVCALPLRGPLAASLFRTLTHADGLLTELRASQVTVPATRAEAGPVGPTPPPASDDPAASPSGSPTVARRTGVRGASVASILLGLGALCLLVAAVIFLAVAWSWLGVGGRTTVLVGLTLTTGGVATWLGARGLRVAAESLMVVSLGLLTLDVAGADNAGWLGDLTSFGFASALGATLLAASVALLFVRRPLVAPQVVAVLGLAALAGGVLGNSTHDQVVTTVAVLGYAGLAGLGRLRRLAVLPWAALVGAAGWWLALLALALDDATGDRAGQTTAFSLLLQGHRLGLLVAAALLLIPLLFTRSTPLRQVGLGACASLVTVTVGLPGPDDGATRSAVLVLVLLVLWSGALAAVPESWRRPTLAPVAVCAVPVAAVAAALMGVAVDNASDVGAPFSRAVGVHLHDVAPPVDPSLLVPCVLGLLLAIAVAVPAPARRAWPAAAGVMVLAGIGTLALHPVPLWTVTTALGLTALALAGYALRRSDPLGSWEAAAGSVLAGTAALAALPSAVLTSTSLAVLVLGAAAVAWRGRFPESAVGAWLVLPPATAGLIWSVSEVAGLGEAYRATPVLLVLAAMAVLRPRAEVELTAGLAGLLAAVTSVGAASDPVTSLAFHLTLAGALVTTSALVNPSRRSLGWVGGALLAAATWVRFVEIGVHSPEAYTLPSAVALLLVGLRRLSVDPSTPTLRALTPGLVLATTPSLLWVIGDDAVSLRAALLGLGCLGLVMLGVRLRWNAPLLVGSSVGALLVLRELAPYAGHTPQWVLIGFAGTVLTLVGITWERRMLELRHAASYLDRLR